MLYRVMKMTMEVQEGDFQKVPNASALFSTWACSIASFSQGRTLNYIPLVSAIELFELAR